MANSIASMEKKLDKALQCVQEIECLKKKQAYLENKNRELEDFKPGVRSCENCNSGEEISTTEQGYRGVGRRCESVIKASRLNKKSNTQLNSKATAAATTSTFSMFRNKKMSRLLSLKKFFATL